MTPSPSTESKPVETSELIDATSLPLAKRVRAGLTWNVPSALITESIRFLRSIILARLLVPADFGIFAMALTVVGALNAISSLGLSRTIVASQFDTNDELQAYLDTVWSVELVRSFAIAVLVSAAAFPMSQFYGQDQLKFIIPMLGSISIIAGFQNIGLALLRKQISFARIFWYELTSNVTGITLTIVLAVVMRNVWALVVGLLLTEIVSTGLSYIFHSYRPRFAFEKGAFRRVLKFGKVTLLIAIASYLMNTADNIMVGRLLGSSALGNYSLAFNIASTPISVLVLSAGAVLFPAYAEIKFQRPTQLGVAFTKALSVALLVIAAIAVSLLLLSGEVVQLLFGSKWTTAGTVLRILALVIPLRGFCLLVSSFFWGLNRPKDVAVCTSIEALIFLAALYPLTKTLGVTGAAWACLIAYGFGCLVRIRVLGQIMPGISRKLLPILLTIVAAAGTSFLIAWFSLGFVTSPLLRLVLGGFICATIPPLILFSLKPDLKQALVDWW